MVFEPLMAVTEIVFLPACRRFPGRTSRVTNMGIAALRLSNR